MMMQMMQLGMSAAAGYMNYQDEKAQYKAQKQMQDYRNKMTNLANAINQNAITTNTTLAIQQSAINAGRMQTEALGIEGAVTASAAAAGVKGRSVNAIMLDAERRAGLKEKDRADQLQQFFLQTDQQRVSSSMSATMNQDLSYIPKPSLARSMIKSMAGSPSSMQTIKDTGASAWNWMTGPSSSGGIPAPAPKPTGY